MQRAEEQIHGRIAELRLACEHEIPIHWERASLGKLVPPALALDPIHDPRNPSKSRLVLFSLSLLSLVFLENF